MGIGVLLALSPALSSALRQREKEETNASDRLWQQIGQKDRGENSEWERENMGPWH